MSRFSCFKVFAGRRLGGRAVGRLSSVLTTFSMLALPLLCGCAKIPDGTVGPKEYGMVEIRLRMADQKLNKSAAVEGVAQTTAESVVVEVSGADLAPTKFKVKIDPSRPSTIDTVKGVPVGKDRRISIWAVDKKGDTTHIDSVEYHFADVENGAASRVSATLIPAAGSIYLMLYGLETGSVSGVHASFSSLDGKRVFENYADRAPRTFVHIDNIPHGLEGVLRVSLVNSKMDTVKTATQMFTFDARKDSTISLQFIENTGMIGMDVALLPPGVTAGSYNFSTSVSDVNEIGGLIITEIMFSASDDNYIELHNTQNKEAAFDTLAVDIDGKVFQFVNVSISANGYLVIGHKSAAYTNYVIGNSNIVSTGNWITVRKGKTGAILDRVICGGVNSAIGWPSGLSSSSKRSVELNRDKYNEIENNFGKNWSAATEPIPATNLYGTPGR